MQNLLSACFAWRHVEPFTTLCEVHIAIVQHCTLAGRKYKKELCHSYSNEIVFVFVGQILSQIPHSHFHLWMTLEYIGQALIVCGITPQSTVD